MAEIRYVIDYKRVFLNDTDHFEYGEIKTEIFDTYFKFTRRLNELFELEETYEVLVEGVYTCELHKIMP